MIVDTSAIMAILLFEPERPDFIRALGLADRSAISAGSWIELGVVLLRRKQPINTALLDTLAQSGRLAIEPVTVEQAMIGRTAYSEYGHGSGHAADLNFGDCFAYALAKATGEPLLFKGNDFKQTDITPAL